MSTITTVAVIVLSIDPSRGMNTSAKAIRGSNSGENPTVAETRPATKPIEG